MSDRVPTQLVLYTTDAVDVSYSDGSRLQLSPCAASFVWTCPPKANQHPLQGTERLHQRTQFVTSAFYQQVREAVEFRNRFAERPYLCPRILDSRNILKLHANITEVIWEESPLESVEVLPDGSRRVQSADSFAAVTLSPCGQMFSVEYMAKISQPNAKLTRAPLPKHSVSTSSTANTDSSMKYTTFGPLSTITPCSDMKDHLQEFSRDTLNCTFGETTLNNACTNPDVSQPFNTITNQTSSQTEYTWSVQHFSIMDYPLAWAYPLTLLQESDQRVVRVQESSSEGVCEVQTNPKLSKHSDKKNIETDRDCNQNKGKNICSELKDTLPISCNSQHLHKWHNGSFDGESEPQNGMVKVLCSRGIIYKLNWGSPKAIEVYPGDGSIVRSNGIAGHYFTHFFYKENKVEEKTYSVKHPPPNVVGEPYPKGQIIQKAARLLDLACTMGLQPDASGEVSCCWKVKPVQGFIEPIASILLEETSYPGLGKFTAFSSGRIRVLYEDRTNLSMQADFSKRIGQFLKHSGIPTGGDDQICHARKPVALKDIPKDMCRLLLPNGKYEFVDIKNPGSHAKYVQPALEWVTWVNTSPSERSIFYKDTIHDPQKNASVNAELARINCFKYLLDNKVMPELQLGNASQDVHNITDDLSKINLGPRFDLGLDTGDYTRPSQKMQKDCEVNLELGDLDMVKNILLKNSQAVEDLDTFLRINGESTPVTD